MRQTPHEAYAIVAGCDCERPGAAPLGELHRESTDAARGAVNDHGLAALEMQGIIDPLLCGEGGHRGRTSGPQAHSGGSAPPDRRYDRSLQPAWSAVRQR